MKSTCNPCPGWLDAIPSNWEIIPAKAAFLERRQRSRTTDVHLTPSQKFGILPQEEYMRITGTRVVLNLEGQDNMKHVEANDFVIHLRSFQGGIEWSSLPGKVSMAYTVLSPRGRNVLPAYYRWTLKSLAYIRELSSTTDQLRDGQSIKYSTFAKVPLPLPPLDEQRAIADYLDHETVQIDALVEKQEELAATLRERRRSVVDRELDSGSLGHTRLKNLLDRNDGGVWGEDAARSEGTVVLRSTEQTVDGRWRIEDPARRSLTAKEFKAALLEVGDLLVTKTSGSSKHIGKTTLVEEHVSSMSACFGNFMQRLRARSGTSPKFLWYCLNSRAVREQFDLLSTTSTGLSNLNGSTIGSVLVPLHPESKQYEIVDHLDEQTSRIDTLIAKAEEHIALANERRSALITAAVTGQIDVRTAAQKAS